MKSMFKFLSGLIATIFLWQSIVAAAPMHSSVVNVTKQLDTTSKINQVNDLFVPESFGSIDKKWAAQEAGAGKFVVHIQDAHCNYEAQNNITRILEVLIRDYKVDLVCVEGAEGKVDPSLFAAYPDQKVREKVADKYVKKGYLTAAEALAVSQADNLPFTIYGVEDTTA